MLRVTVWYCQNKDGSWSHNHIEDGWALDLDMPTAINKHQETAWAGKKWKPVYAFKTSDGLVSEKAAYIVAIKTSDRYNFVPTDELAKDLEEHRRCPYE